MKRFGCFLICMLLSIAYVTAAVSSEGGGYRPLQYGDSGDIVTLIQEQLSTLGYYSGEISGEYLDDTKQSVAWFQTDFSLEVTGMVDGETEAMLFNVEYRPLTTGDTGDDVKRIQERLNALDYYFGKLSGDYLEGTTFGVRKFQEKNGLEATGTADIATQRRLFSDGALSRYAGNNAVSSEHGDTGDAASPQTTYTMDYVGKITRGAHGKPRKTDTATPDRAAVFQRPDQRQLPEPDHRGYRGVSGKTLSDGRRHHRF